MRSMVLRSTISLLIAAAGAAANAQAAENREDSAEAPKVEEIVVTGSRISGLTNLTSASPLSIATHEDIVLSKSSSLAEVLDRIPSIDFNGGQSAANNNGSATSSVALRNLGPQRTLVLIDGQRLIPQNGGVVDLNVLPVALIDHVEVLKDGASSIYGADAIGGVINVITKKRADGLSLDGNYGTSNSLDGMTYGGSASLGSSTERGSVMVALSYNRRNPIPQSERSWATDTHATDPNYPGGSAWRSQISLLQNENDLTQVWAGAPNSSVVRSTTDPTIAPLGPNQAYVSGRGRVLSDAGGEGWNYLTAGLDQKQISLASHYDVNDHVTVVGNGFFVDTTDRFQVRPEPLYGDTIATPTYPGFIIPTTNPYNVSGSDIAAYLVPAQFGPRKFTVNSQTYRMQFGLEGKLYDDYKWEAGYVFQRNSQTFGEANAGNYNHLAQITGQSPCVDVPGGCTNGLPTVPVNFFNAPNIFTPAQVSYLTTSTESLSHELEPYAYADINGPLFNLPAGSVKGAIGFESREEHYDNTPEEAIQMGQIGGGVSLPTSGGYHVNAFYGEIRIPLLKDLPFAKELNLTPSVRYDDYSDFGGQTTYKFGIDYAMTDEVRLRGAYATAIRAPQVTELYSGTTIGFPSFGGDPCETNAGLGIPNYGKGVLTAGSTCSKAVAGGAAVTGFTDPLDNGGSTSVQTTQGGNPHLQPEKAHIYTAGVVFNPHFIPSLTLAVDYYNIRISNTILTSGVAGAVGADFVLNGCYGPAQNPGFCSLITRDSRGTIVAIDSTATNIGRVNAAGIDFELGYNTRGSDWTIPRFGGYFNFDLSVTNQIKNDQTNPDGTLTRFNGYFNPNNETNQPRWKGILAADYVTGPFKFRYNLRGSEHTVNIDGSQPQYGNYVPNLFYHDISLSYDLPHMADVQQARIIFGVDNLANKEPPFIGTDGTCRCNSIAGPFDFVGRYFYTRVSVHL